MSYEHKMPKSIKYEVFARASVYHGKKWIEGYCEDCGNFDLLIYRAGLYLCALSSELQQAREERAETLEELVI